MKLNLFCPYIWTFSLLFIAYSFVFGGLSGVEEYNTGTGTYMCVVPTIFRELFFEAGILEYVYPSEESLHIIYLN